MKLQSKANYLIVGTLAIVSVALSAVALLAFRAYSLDAAREQARMAGEIIRVGLTEEMVNGTIDRRPEWFARLKDIPGLREVHVVRGQPVIDQFGAGVPSDYPVGEAEKRVLETGQVVEEIFEGRQVFFQYTIPYIAHKKGTPNCMQCHHVREGAVLGAVSLKTELTEQRSDALKTIGILVGLLILFGTLLAYLLRHLLIPIVQTTAELQTAVTKADEGDFSHRLVKRSEDEIGDIADQANHLMTTLENSMGSIVREVESLSEHYAVGAEKNLIKRTVAVVHNMVAAARFKREIENDRDMEEVYARIRRVLKQEFGLTRFSLYEVNADKNKLRLVFAEGLPETAELWCDPEILVSADACRAWRTAQPVTSEEEPGICTAFFGNKLQESEDLLHACLPVMLGGSVGGVLQMVFGHEEAAGIEGRLPTIRTYLAEASPVIESKRLMQVLRESALRDALTGLYNRRFLEEYVPTLTASVARRKGSLGVLMVDVDFFKQVNDTLGHEIGDMVLKGLAEIMQQTLRASDVLVRYGGEEFLALLPDTEEATVLQVAERIRAFMEGHTFQTTSGPLRKTLSVGVSVYPSDGDAFWECVKYADVALYAAKEGGRNKVLRFTPDMWQAEGKY